MNPKGVPYAGPAGGVKYSIVFHGWVQLCNGI